MKRHLEVVTVMFAGILIVLSGIEGSAIARGDYKGRLFSPRLAHG